MIVYLQVLGQRTQIKLKKGAIPSIFDPSVINTSNNNIEITLPEPLNSNTLIEPFRKQLFGESMNKSICTEPSLEVSLLYLFKEILLFTFIVLWVLCDTIVSLFLILFKDPFSNFKDIILPVGWMLYRGVNIMSLYKPNILDGIKVVIEKQIVFHSSSLDINYYVNQKCINPTIVDLKQLTYPLNTLDVIENIKLFEQKKICQGGPNVINFPGLMKICY